MLSSTSDPHESRHDSGQDTRDCSTQQKSEVHLLKSKHNAFHQGFLNNSCLRDMADMYSPIFNIADIMMVKDMLNTVYFSQNHEN